jgi:hypothetical protein
MMPGLFKDLRGLKDVVFHNGADAQVLTKFETEKGLIFPPEHKELLRLSNGVETYAGYVRLFGVHTTEEIDSVRWNDHGFWKFAWEDRCSAYWCFGETAWGDQYAYSLESLQAGGDAAVVFMDALSMTPEVVAPSFVEFLLDEFVRSATDPYDAMIKLAREKFGTLEATDHLVYVPSVLLGGTEDIANVQKMNARSAMICNGDIAMQLDAAPAGGTIKAVQPYEDEMHRTRLRVVWE